MYLFSKYCFQVSHHLQLILYFVVDAITIKLLLWSTVVLCLLSYVTFSLGTLMSHMTTYFWGNFSVKIFIVCCTLKECFAQYWCPILLNLTSIVNCRQSSPPVQESQFHWFFSYLIFPVICSTCSQVWCFSNLNQTHHFVLQKGNDMFS